MGERCSHIMEGGLAPGSRCVKPAGHYDGHRSAIPPKECSVKGCSKPSHARGWCAAHYTRASRYGSPSAPHLVGRGIRRPGPIPVRCRRGHLLDPENLYRGPRSWYCRACKNELRRPVRTREEELALLIERQRRDMLYGDEVHPQSLRGQSFMSVDYTTVENPQPLYEWCPMVSVFSEECIA